MNFFNLGTNEYCAVNLSIEWISEKMKLSPKLIYSEGEQGWIGDNPFIYLVTKRICDLGWKPKLSIEISVKLTVDYLLQNTWLMGEK